MTQNAARASANPATVSTEPPPPTSGGRAPGAEPLIGVEDVKTPYWVQVDESVVGARLWAVLCAVPRVTAATVRSAWRVGPRLTVLGGVLQLASGVVSAFGLLTTANVFARLLEDGPAPGRMLAALPALSLVVTAHAAGALLSAATESVRSSLSPRVEQAADDALHAALARVDLVAFDDPDFVELVHKADHASPNLRMAVRSVGELLSSLVSVGAAVVTAALLHPALAPLVLLTALPQAWASVRSARINHESFLAMTSRARRLNVTSHLLMSRREAAEVRAYTAGPLLLAEHRRIAESLTREALATQRRTTRVRLAGRALAGVGTGAAYLVLGTLVYLGALPLALAGTAALAMRAANGAVTGAVFAANQLYEASFHLELHTTCLGDAAARTRAAARPAIPGPVPTERPVGPHVIELTGVTFRYPGQERPAVDGVSLTLRAGEVTALVGENGSGKTTLAALLCGLYLPERGTVTWDGVDVSTIDPAELHDRLALVLQYPTEWPMTAANNIRIGRPDRPDPTGRRLATAARSAGADSVVAGLDNGWHTVLSPRFHTGQDLSGGQWQRISVARGLYRDAGLVIADEPTAALDAKAEHTVFRTLRRLHTQDGAPDRITVLITHRLANVRAVDHIAVLDDGRLTDQGTHDELMSRPSVYSELFTLQARAYGSPDP